MRTIDSIIIHCAYTPPGMDIGATEIRRWHVEERGWKDIGYHYVVRRDGDVEPGRDLDGDGDVVEEVGAHAAGHNAHSIGICLVGGRAEDDQAPDCNFTPAQWSSLQLLVTDLLARFPGIAIMGHRDVAPHKACPTFDATAWGAALKESLND